MAADAQRFRSATSGGAKRRKATRKPYGIAHYPGERHNQLVFRSGLAASLHKTPILDRLLLD